MTLLKSYQQNHFLNQSNNMTYFQQSKIYDLLNSDALLNPYSLYDELRKSEPVYFYEPGNFWFLSRYKDVEAALLDPRLSSEKKELFSSQSQKSDIGWMKNYLQLIDKVIVDKDPPEHTRIRRVANIGFAAKTLENWRAIVQEVTDNLLDAVQDRNEMDIVADLSEQLPAIVICKILGIPEQKRKEFLQWGFDIANFWGMPKDDNIEELAHQVDLEAKLFIVFVQELIEERRRQPGTDLISVLVSAYEENGQSFDELPALCYMILVAGYTTPCDCISNGVNALLCHPAQLQKLKENPETIGTAIEEMIRFDAPTPVMFRTAKENLTIGDKEIKQGSIVALGFGSANYDPDKFDNPEVFDITRSPNEHLGFGKGVHFCLGAALARMQLTICFSTLLKRMPNICFDPNKPAIPKRDSLVFKGFRALPVKF